MVDAGDAADETREIRWGECPQERSCVARVLHEKVAGTVDADQRDGMTTHATGAVVPRERERIARGEGHPAAIAYDVLHRPQMGDQVSPVAQDRAIQAQASDHVDDAVGGRAGLVGAGDPHQGGNQGAIRDRELGGQVALDERHGRRGAVHRLVGMAVELGDRARRETDHAVERLRIEEREAHDEPSG